MKTLFRFLLYTLAFILPIVGFELHINYIGPTTTGNPTVILETGLGATAAVWGWV